MTDEQDRHKMIRRNISMTQGEWAEAQDEARENGDRFVSPYIRRLLRQDIRSNDSGVVKK